MTIHSLQKIISLENELYAAEKAEKEKAAQWLMEEEAEILRRHREDLDELAEKKRLAGERAEAAARKKAAAVLQRTQKLVAYLDSLEDDILLSHLKNVQSLLAGRVE